MAKGEQGAAATGRFLREDPRKTEPWVREAIEESLIDDGMKRELLG